MEKLSNKTYKKFLFIIVTSCVFFYLPFLSREFMLDDWLWLDFSRDLAQDFWKGVLNPQFGYYRPFYLIWFYIVQETFGLNSLPYNLIIILSNSFNIFLISKLLDKFEVDKKCILGICFTIGFYFLSFPALLWISVGHDIYCLTFVLLFSLELFELKIAKTKTLSIFKIILFSLLAIGFKESGFIVLPLYFIFFFIFNENPFKRSFVLSTLSTTLIIILLLIWFMKINPSLDTKINWTIFLYPFYFLGYLITPIPERFNGLPDAFKYFLLGIRFLSYGLVVLGLISFWKKRQKALIYFSSIALMYFILISKLNWEISLTDFSPRNFSNRYMYMAVPSLVSCILIYIWNKFSIRIATLRKELVVVIAITFITVNFVLISHFSKSYFIDQKNTKGLYSSLAPMISKLENQDKILAIVVDTARPPYELVSRHHLKSMIKVKFNKTLKPTIINKIPTDSEASKYELIFKWEPQNSKSIEIRN